MPLFFGFKRPIAASVDVVTLLGTTGYLTYIWSKVDQTAAWTMVPYLAWLSFATYLCVSVSFLWLVVKDLAIDDLCRLGVGI